ncbi:MAG: hypothetical protein ACI8WB_006039 [Phenylobacterium sp.]|jgi:hypothetical protein
MVPSRNFIEQELIDVLYHCGRFGVNRLRCMAKSITLFEANKRNKS